MSKEKVKVSLQRVCLTLPKPDGTTVAPFIDALRAVRRLQLPARTFYWLNKISLLLEKEFEEYETARRKLVMDLGTQTTVGYELLPENREKFDAEMATLNREVDLPLDTGVKLALPANGVAEDWFLLMSVMDIFEEPK